MEDKNHVSNEEHPRLAHGGIGDRLTQLFDKIAGWHEAVIVARFPAPLPISRAFFLCVCLIGLLACYMNYHVRANQYQIWQENKAQFYLDDTPLFSTTDASYFLGLARQLDTTGNLTDYNDRRLYPTLKSRHAEDEPRNSLRDFPLLSVLISWLSPDSSTTSLLKTGNALIPVFGFIMAAGIMLAFGASGFWLSGAVAAVGAGLSFSFIARSSIGRIDTDILNLGFFYAVLGLTILAARSKSWRGALFWVVAAGLCLNLFFWWYEKAFMGWAFAIGLIWLSFISSRDWRRPLVLGALFLILSGLVFKAIGLASDSAYLVDVLVQGALIFPNTFKTITELAVVPFDRILTNITGSFWLGIVGLIGLALFGLRHPVIAVVYGPASIFALANFLVGNRAIFYSAPMLWFGVSFFVLLLIQLAYHFAPPKLTSWRFSQEVTLSAVALSMIVGIVQFMPSSYYVPRATFPKEVLRGFQAADGNLPENAVIATWWDYGYASMLFNRYNTLHDGGSQTSPATHYVARALLAPSQQEAASILRYLSADGLPGIEANASSYEALEAAIAKGPKGAVPPLFLALTNQMGDWIGSISKLGLWDVKTGAPIALSGLPARQGLMYVNLTCRASEQASMNCNDNPIDLQAGTISGQPVLRAATQAKNGFSTAGQLYRDDATSLLHLSDVDGRGTQVMAIHERLAQTTFHQLFHLGQADQTHFRLVYDDYPHMRIYEVQ